MGVQYFLTEQYARTFFIFLCLLQFVIKEFKYTSIGKYINFACILRTEEFYILEKLCFALQNYYFLKN